MTDRLLSMLYQYLLSNQNLELNRSFQIYFKILSVEHSKFKKTQPQRTRAIRKRPKIHVGVSGRKFNYKWGIDIPQEEGNFINKCLLLCTIMGLAQMLYYESLKKNKLYQYLSLINSKTVDKKNYAIKLFNNQLKEIFSSCNLKQVGPYKLKTTIILLSKKYNCQFFIFESYNSLTKLYFMYPSKYKDFLKPIYLFRPKFDSNHVVFIRNIGSFFRSNSYCCFACHKHFKRYKDSRSPHLCKVREVCFACRRFFQLTLENIVEMLLG